MKAFFTTVFGLVATGYAVTITRDESTDCSSITCTPSSGAAHIIVTRASTELPGTGTIGAVADAVVSACPGSDIVANPCEFSSALRLPTPIMRWNHGPVSNSQLSPHNSPLFNICPEKNAHPPPPGAHGPLPESTHQLASEETVDPTKFANPRPQTRPSSTPTSPPRPRASATSPSW